MENKNKSTSQAKNKQGNSTKKSGMILLKPGEILFKEKDIASSLYIIQSGQIRLFRPKGRGFIDLAILRSGEVIGEMAYFDDKSRSRSASASAIISTKIIEISFIAFDKAMKNLNPWFKTIIYTLADRLRKTNEKVRELESNSIGFSSGGKVADYVFFKKTDIIKILTTIYLVMEAKGKMIAGVYTIHMTTLQYYLYDVYSVPEIKWEEFLAVLIKQNLVTLTADQDKALKIINIEDLEKIKNIFSFFNSQKRLDDSKKMVISDKCQILLADMLKQVEGKGFKGDKVHVDVGKILEEYKEKNIRITSDDLTDAIKAGLCYDILIGDDSKLIADIKYDLLTTLYPSICLDNCINKINSSKQDKKGYS